MSDIETNQIMKRLNGLTIVDTPRQRNRENVQRDCHTEIAKKTQVPATPCSGAATFLTELKKRRKMKFNRVYNYEADQHFIKARKSLKF